ncbi:hypothetical protein [Paraburkholderia sp. BCC1886]|uniref:hypothetical protein n=1 Tax=Paraburkholderia sp. BCC1886 TaxID=2562670 RepID=UPI0021B15984|nr:hypothetical protein [Paraburkholderia sp. BCC1886]
MKWNRSRPGTARVECAIADGSNGSVRHFLTVSTILSRRSVRRHNSTAARAFIAVRTDEVASLLP